MNERFLGRSTAALVALGASAAMCDAHPQTGDNGECEVHAMYGPDLSGLDAATEHDSSADGLDGSWNQGQPYPEITPDRRPVFILQMQGFCRRGGQNQRETPYLQNPAWADDGDDGYYHRGCPDDSYFTRNNVFSEQPGLPAEDLVFLPERPSEENPGNGIPDSIDWLLWKLEIAYRQGYRRAVLHLPAGSIDGNWYSSSHWWTLTQTKRDALREHLPAWLETHPDMTLGIYQGFKQLAPCDLCMRNRNTSDLPGGADCSHVDDLYRTYVERYFEPGEQVMIPLTPRADDQYLMNVLKANIRPWADLGVKEFWMEKGIDTVGEGGEGCVNPDDAVCNPEPWFLRAQMSPDFADVRLGAEPFMMDPWDQELHGDILGRDGQPIPRGRVYFDDEAMRVTRSVTNLQFFEGRSRFRDNVVWRDGTSCTWKVDPETTEAGVIINRREAEVCTPSQECLAFAGGSAHCPPLTNREWFDLFRSWSEAGFVLWTDEADLTRWIVWTSPRLDSRGEVLHRFDIEDWAPNSACLADLDRNGVVGAFDLALLINRPTNVPGFSPAQGDLDGDGLITAGDLAILLNEFGKRCDFLEPVEPCKHYAG